MEKFMLNSTYAIFKWIDIFIENILFKLNLFYDICKLIQILLYTNSNLSVIKLNIIFKMKKKLKFKKILTPIPPTPIISIGWWHEKSM